MNILSRDANCRRLSSIFSITMSTKNIFFLIVITINLINPSTSIFNGRPASFNQFPYHVVLFTNHKSGRVDFCGGTLLSPTIVLTAGHCLFDNGKPRFNRLHPEFRILAGFRHLNDQKAILTCPKWFLVHPNHDKDHKINDTQHLSYDYAIIKLETSVTSMNGRNIAYVGIPKQDYEVEPGGHGLLAGTGYIGNKVNSRHLFFTEFTVLPSNVCELAYMSDTRTGLCVQAKDKNTGICAGDSGSGFIINTTNNLVIIGIVSYDEDKNCGESYPSAVFSKVSTVTNWILDVMDKNENEIHELQLPCLILIQLTTLSMTMQEHLNIQEAKNGAKILS